MHSLADLGWNNRFQSQLIDTPEDLVPARIAEEQRGAYLLLTEDGPLSAAVSGRLMHDAGGREDFPAVGDWVLARPLLGEARAVIHSVLARRTKLSRKTAGETTDEQILAANVDTVFLVTSMNQEMNLRRIERYLTVIWESGATPVILLNKADLAENAPQLVSEVEDIAPGVDVYFTSALTGDGVEAVRRYLHRGQTVVFIGSSGVGKSSLVNRLLEEDVQAVSHIRDDGKGRHTTTSREMMLVPAGGLIIDTPGLRELQLWEADSGVGQTFADVEDLAQECAFADCNHGSEPGCSVQTALTNGAISRQRLDSYRKLQREQYFIESKKDVNLRNAEKKKWKQIHKAVRLQTKLRDR